MPPIVIIGAGPAGGRAAEALRAEGWDGRVILIGSEPTPPYERPPLSKGILLGERSFDSCSLFSASFFVDRGIETLFGAKVAGIRRGEREVFLEDGRSVAYHRLLIATGAEPRRLAIPGCGLDGIRYLRTIDDACHLATDLGIGRRLVIVGGGLIGLEVAASAVQRGATVTVLEAAPRLMMRAVPVQVASVAAARHRAAGVDVRLGCELTAFLGVASVVAIRLSDDSTIACDAVLVAIGAAPDIDVALAAGLAVDNGIIVDRMLRTDDERIFAAGDVCSFPHDIFERRIRLEHWKNAEDQGRLAARNMLGQGEVFSAIPWFWSDQYELNIQVAGFHDFGKTHVARRLGHETIVVFHLDVHGRVVGTSGVGPEGSIGRDVRIGQMMIEKRMRPAPSLLADTSVNLKSLLKEETV